SLMDLTIRGHCIYIQVCSPKVHWVCDSKLPSYRYRTKGYQGQKSISVIEAARPKEVLYFFHVHVRAQQGMAYFFSAMDAYSEYIINLGTSLSLDENTVISHIKKLLRHKDFKRSPKKPFTLVCAIGENYQNRIRGLLLPEKGKLAIGAHAVEQSTKSFS